jgi:hypothetical protein
MCTVFNTIIPIVTAVGRVMTAAGVVGNPRVVEQSSVQNPRHYIFETTVGHLYIFVFCDLSLNFRNLSDVYLGLSKVYVSVCLSVCLKPQLLLQLSTDLDETWHKAR